MANRYSAESWIELGLRLLANEGPEALTVDELCAAAHKTKGSFYFHFGAIDDFLNEITQYWHEEFTRRIIELPPPVSERTDLLSRIAGRVDLDLESGMRKLAARNGKVDEIVRRADEERVRWLTECYEKSGRYNPEQAAALARIEYAAFVGFRLIDPDLAPGEARKLYDQFLEFTGRDT